MKRTTRVNEEPIMWNPRSHESLTHMQYVKDDVPRIESIYGNNKVRYFDEYRFVDKALFDRDSRPRPDDTKAYENHEPSKTRAISLLETGDRMRTRPTEDFVCDKDVCHEAQKPNMCFANRPELLKSNLVNLTEDKTVNKQFTNQRRFPRQSTNRKYTENRPHYNVETDSESDNHGAGREETRDTKSDYVKKRSCKEWIKLERYDGSTSLDTYLAHFQNCNDYNGWNEADRIAHLRASLFGNAAQVLWGLTAAEITFDGLSEKLKQRFGNAGQTAKYRAELRARRRGKTETLQNLYQDIRRLLVLAYPGDSSPSAEAIAMESFLQALDDKEFELRLCEKEPESLDELFRHALRLEANDRAINSRHDSKRTGGNQVRSLVSDNPLDQICLKLEKVIVSQQRTESNFKRLENEYEQLKSKMEQTLAVHDELHSIARGTEVTGGAGP